MKKTIPIFMIIIGIALILYPIWGTYLNKNKNMRDIQQYEEKIREKDNEEIQEIKINYEKYNGIIGHIEIPKIDIKLPIYPNSQEKYLLKGVGILEGSMLPSKETSYHCIIVGHTGITGKNFFDNIGKLSEKDIFFVEILNEKYKYEICKVNTVLPNETQNLITKEGDKLITLVTCTPKYINTHRLLVTGTKVRR